MQTDSVSLEARQAVIAKFTSNGMNPDMARRMVEGWSADNPTLVMLSRFEALIRADAYEQAAKWQPIETAPRDGTEVLIFADRTVLQARYAEEDDGTWEQGRFGLGFGGEYGGDPTHWMPLPEPPAALKSEAPSHDD